MNTTFTPAPLLSNSHLQTLYAPLLRKEKLEGRRLETFGLSDGDEVECVWYGKTPHLQRPIVTLFHGLEGSVESPYIIGIMKALDASGFAPVLMHFRGCGTHPNKTPRAYHSGDTADARAWITHLHSTYPEVPLYAAGFSIGGNVLLKLLGEWGSAAPLSAAVAVSVPMQLDISADTLERGFARLYQKHLLEPLKARLLEKYDRFDMEKLIGTDTDRVRAIKTIREFDELYTARIHGFASAQAYYEASSSRQYLKSIAVPTLILHAKDDPFMTPEVLPEAGELSQAVDLEVSDHGGHVGFVSGSIKKPEYWLEKRIVNFFEEKRGLSAKD
jgi:predicted alpha/beta-fold hydrolase